MKKRLFSMLLMVLTLNFLISFPDMVYAAQNGRFNDTITWELDNGTLRLSGYGELVNEYNSYPWHSTSGQIVDLDISEGITKIGRMAFWGCNRLTTVTLPNSITEIGDNAFTYCSNLTTISFGNNLKSIERECFDSCYKLENIQIPDSVVYLGRNIFEDTAWWSSFWEKQKNGEVYVGKVLYKYKGSPSGQTNIKVKSDTRGIADAALYFSYGGNNVKSITLPNSLEYIGEQAFECTGISELIIPNSVYHLGAHMCLGCENLERVTFPNGITEIPASAFDRCKSLKTINIPNTVISIQDGAFWNSGLESIVIPNSVTYIGEFAFRGTNLTSAIIGSGVKIIGEDAFNVNSLNGCTYYGSEEDWNSIIIKYGRSGLYKGNDHLIPVTYKKDSTGQSIISVVLNGTELSFDQPPVIIDERTLVPLRAIFEAMGASVDWNGATQTVTSTKGSTTVEMTINSATIYKNGITIYLDVPAQLVGDYTMVPVRAVAEAFGAEVTWDGDSHTVYIDTSKKLNALIINADTEITEYDAALFRQVLLNNKIAKVDESNIHCFIEPNANEFELLVDMLIKQAGEDDITYFYYTGHGGIGGGAHIAPDYNHSHNATYEYTMPDLIDSLNRVPGTVVIILDSCYSGAINEIQGLNTDKFKILTACEGNQYSYTEYLLGGGSFFDKIARLILNDDIVNGYFSSIMLNGLGAYSGGNILTRYNDVVKADANKDNNVTLGELYRYIDDNMDKTFTDDNGNKITQNPTISDASDETIIYSY